MAGEPAGRRPHNNARQTDKVNLSRPLLAQGARQFGRQLSSVIRRRRQLMPSVSVARRCATPIDQGILPRWRNRSSAFTHAGLDRHEKAIALYSPPNKSLGLQNGSQVIHHIDFAVTDLARSRKFYERALAPIGLRVAITFTSHSGHNLIGFGQAAEPVFWIRDGEPLIGRLHVAFAANSREEVQAFHAAALHAGGKDNGPPAFRPRYAEHWYAAFVLDPDGHNIEAVCRREEPNTPMQPTCEDARG